LDDARDPAAVPSWRLDRVVLGGPLPWLDGIPSLVTRDSQWGPYLDSRSDLVRDLASQIREVSVVFEQR